MISVNHPRRPNVNTNGGYPAMTDEPTIDESKRARAKGSGLRAVAIAALLGLILLLAAGSYYWSWVDTVNKAMDALEAGRLGDARTFAKKAITLSEPVSKFSPNSHAISLRLLMNIYACRRVFAMAEEMNSKLLAFDKEVWGADSVEYADEIAGLALMKRKQREFEKSAELYFSSIQTYKKFPKCKAECARVQALVAWDLIQLAKNDEAQKVLEESDAELTAQFGLGSFERLVGLMEQAYIKKSAGDGSWKPLVLIMYKMVTEPPLDKSSAQTVVVLNLMAQMLLDMGEEKKALRVFEIAEQNCKSSVFGSESNSYMADILIPESKLLAKLGREKEEKLKLERAAVNKALRFSDGGADGAKSL